MKTVFALLIAVVVAAGGAAYYVHNNRAEKTSFRTALIERGELAITIDASGTLQPEEVVDVGAQITGKILSFGPDADRPGKSVDFCSTVRKDQLLANIDPTYYQAKVEQCKAALKKSEAELEQMKANCAQAKNAWERAKELRPLQAIADSDYDAAEANYLVALANIAVGEAGLRQAKAALDMAEVDLGYTVIRSPIDGEIIKRRVNVGQTVTAGLNTPSIFLIAKDLRRMEIWVLVNEMDIGRIRLNMPVRFTVDAFTEEVFHGVVTQIRKDAVMTSNVVSYTVVVTTDNPERKLFPYMTANVRFEVERRSDILLAPNAALQWTPAAEQIVPGHTTGPTDADGQHNHRKLLWLLDGDLVRPLEVAAGITDGLHTEISGEGVKDGMQIVVGTTTGQMQPDDAEGTSVPFMPSRPRGSRQQPR